MTGIATRAGRPAVALLSLALLAGCGLFGGGFVSPEDEADPARRACRAEAEKAPGLTALGHQYMPEDRTIQARINREERVIVDRAFRECMRGRGARIPGGVEAPRAR